ncbi:hypothetical protein GI584_05845 [Gracilibacillus salitolerans]|uniref:Core domain-containing protein n=2 Tax=Gracilibacillus salitolerans TaxID=2663022 RepID=A0A5Q2TPK3_9BACI|nr:hypothetical protein GI584_05845 [Gracilibacillus salitolerans]
MIHITKEAQQKLLSIELQDGVLPRIDAEVAGGCGLTVNYVFIFDHARRNDTIYQSNGFPIRVDYFTKRYLEGNAPTIDYADGFHVINDVEFDSC